MSATENKQTKANAIGKMKTFVSRQKQTYLSSINEGYVTNEQIERLQALIHTDPAITCILEIGFNGGNSAAAMLSVRDNINVVSFDIGSHGYITPAKKLIDDLFPSRHTLIIGNSTRKLPEYKKRNPQAIFDAAFVDGGHGGEVPYLDIKNSCSLVKKGGLIIIDDIAYPDVIDAVDRAKKEGLISETRHPTLTTRTWSECRRM